MRSRNVRGARASLIALAIIVPSLYVGFALNSAVQDYQVTVKSAELDARSTSAALIEHANRAIGEADRFLIGAVGEIERSGLSPTAGNAEALHTLLQKYTNKLPQLGSINVVDMKGRMVASGLDGPAPQIDVSDRDYFRYYSVPGNTGLFISHPFSSRLSNNWVFAITRRIVNADGSPKMLLLAGIPISYFDTFYASLRADSENSLLLAHSDGTVLAENPEPVPHVVRDISQSALFEHYRQQRAGRFENDSDSLDDTARIVGYAGSIDYPLLAISSKSKTEVLTRWRKGVEQTAVIGVFFISLFLALIALLRGRLNDLLARQTDLEEKNASLALTAQVFDTSWQGIIISSADGTILRTNKAFSDIFGYSAEELVGSNIALYESSYVDSGMYQMMMNSLSANGSWLGEARTRTKSGEILTVRQSVSEIRDAGGAVRSVVAILQDVTEQKLSEYRLHQLAHFDALTDLPNRRTFSGADTARNQSRGAARYHSGRIVYRYRPF